MTNTNESEMTNANMIEVKDSAFDRGWSDCKKTTLLFLNKRLEELKVNADNTPPATEQRYIAAARRSECEEIIRMLEKGV